MKAELNVDQAAALKGILERLSGQAEGGKRLLLLSGYAGTGKTFLMKRIAQSFQGRTVFTAPTNKAVRVLRDALTDDHYKPECSTLHSLLGLQLSATGAIKELVKPDDEKDLSNFRLLVVDESSMVSEELASYLLQVAANKNLFLLFVGDFAQLPPVGEKHCPILNIFTGKLDSVWVLEKVMRHDNEILVRATAARNAILKPYGSTLKIALGVRSTALRSELEVQTFSAEHFKQVLEEHLRTRPGDFTTPDQCKILAWRNKAVDTANAIVRRHLFDEPEQKWLVGDRVAVQEPPRNLEGKIFAAVEDEGTVTAVDEALHPAESGLKIWYLSVTTDQNQQKVFMLLHEDSEKFYQQELERKRQAAVIDRSKWKAFWAFKEIVHSLRHSYATTVHKSQGSTYNTAYVLAKDIFVNRNPEEARKCFYVAVSRAKSKLIMHY